MKLVKIGILVLFCFIGIEFSNPVSAKTTNEQKNYFSLEEERNIFELVNRERKKRGLDSLFWNPKLSELARGYSQKMARERFFSHFDREGNSVAERAKAMRIKGWRSIGENLFMCEGYEKFADLAVRGWMKSNSHRQNILEENYNESGIGIARSRDGMIYVTQVFVQN